MYQPEYISHDCQVIPPTSGPLLFVPLQPRLVDAVENTGDDVIEATDPLSRSLLLLLLPRACHDLLLPCLQLEVELGTEVVGKGFVVEDWDTSLSGFLGGGGGGRGGRVEEGGRGEREDEREEEGGRGERERMTERRRRGGG